MESNGRRPFVPWVRIPPLPLRSKNCSRDGGAGNTESIICSRNQNSIAEKQFAFSAMSGLTPKSRAGKGQGGDLGPLGAFFAKNAG
jgi:hypothetical protein